MIENYIKGMLEISVEGVNLERFMNRCTTGGIPLYSVYRKRYDFMQCTIRLADFRRIAVINRELRCRIRVRRRYGIRFLFNRVMRRKAFVIGAAMFTVFMIIMSSTIWRIDIDGIDRINATQILNVVNSYNQGVGFFKARCDTKALELAIKKAIPDVDWVIVDINGVVMNVKIVETVEGIPREETEPSQIIAEVSGEIESINAMRGVTKLSSGSRFEVGDVLIDGIIDDGKQAGEEPILTSAIGTVTAKVDYSGTATVSIRDVATKQPTGNTERHLELTVFGYTFGKKPSSFEHYEVSEETYSLFSRGSLFPITAKAVTYEEYQPLTDKEIKEKALDELFLKAYNDAMRRIPIGAEITSRDVDYTYNEKTGVFTATANITAVQSVGVRRKLTEEEIKSIIGD